MLPPNEAHPGLFAMANVRAAPAAPLTVGWNEYAWPATMLADGVPLIVNCCWPPVPDVSADVSGEVARLQPGAPIHSPADSTTATRGKARAGGIMRQRSGSRCDDRACGPAGVARRRPTLVHPTAASPRRPTGRYTGEGYSKNDPTRAPETLSLYGAPKSLCHL